MGSGEEEISCRTEGAVYEPRAGDKPAVIMLRLLPKTLTTSQFVTLNMRIGELSKEVSRRKRVEEQLREQREWLQVTLSSIGDAVIATDTRGQVTFMNEVAQCLTGWTNRDTTDKPLTEVFNIINEETRQPVESPVAIVLREGRTVGLANHTVLIAKDGTETPIDDCAAPIRQADGTIAGTVLVFHGVSEQRNLEKELSQQNAKLLEADRRKDEFLAMLAHELRNPLAPLTTSLTILRKQQTNNPLIEQSCSIMERQVKHLVTLVDDLLDVARITRGRIELRKERVELNDLIDRAVEAVGPLIASKNHDLSVSLPRDTIYLDADRSRIQQVLVNLITNACKFTPPGGIIHLTVQRLANEVTISVKDNGAGLTPEMLPHVFDLFAQGERTLARSEGGLGIGLTMVKKLVELHGGRTAARSDGPGQGSEFILWFPCANVERSTFLPQSSDPVEATSPVRSLRILIVDDNVDAADSLAMLVSSYGHKVVDVVHSGHAAVESIMDNKPEIVFLDLGLPGLNGYEVAKKVQEAEIEPRPQLVAVSGYGLATDKAKARNVGIDYYIVKPVNPERLQDLLASICPS